MCFVVLVLKADECSRCRWILFIMKRMLTLVFSLRLVSRWQMEGLLLMVVLGKVVVEFVVEICMGFENFVIIIIIRLRSLFI